MTDLETYYRGRLRERLVDFARARDAVADGDPEARETVRRDAHQLKGTAASYGFPQITEAARTVVHATDEDLLDTYDALAETIRRALANERDDE